MPRFGWLITLGASEGSAQLGIPNSNSSNSVLRDIVIPLLLSNGPDLVFWDSSVQSN